MAKDPAVPAREPVGVPELELTLTKTVFASPWLGEVLNAVTDMFEANVTLIPVELLDELNVPSLA